jgi:hypothetical protein
MERDGKRWREMERDGERWREMERDGERWRGRENDVVSTEGVYFVRKVFTSYTGAASSSGYWVGRERDLGGWGKSQKKNNPNHAFSK